MLYKDKLSKTSDKIRNDLNAKLHGKTYTFNLPTFQGFGGGSFGGAGAGSNWNYPNNYVELPQYERRTPIITKESFSEAFNRARTNGDPTFEFNGGTYTTEISDNPQYIGKRYQDKTSAVLREVLDDKMKVMSDSTRVEPFIGQPLGVRKRNESEYKYLDGGILKAQEGTGNLLTPHPLSPVGIALNQAKAMAKGKKDQQHLPPGVKEVIGPDGKKVAIRTEQPLQPLEQNIAEWLPGTGDVAEVGYIADDVKNGNYGSAVLAAGLTFIPGNVGKVLHGKRIANKLNSMIKKTSPEKISRYNEVQFINQMFTDPNRAVHVSPNSVYGATKTKKAAHSIGNKWIPGTADVSKVGEDNLVWLWEGSPYRHQWNDQTFISIPIQDDMIQTRQKGAIAVPEIDLTSNETVTLTKNPIVGNFEKHVFIK